MEPSFVDAPDAPGVSAETLRKVDRAASALSTRAVALMDDRLPWFRSLPADQRSWVTLVAQAGISGYVTWATGASTSARLTEQVFGTAPRDLTRAVSLRRTVELVRVAITVADEQLPALASTPEEHQALSVSLLRYSREVAFAAASVYAGAAESRSSWDARVEAAVVDGIVRGQRLDELTSQAATLDWDTTAPTSAVVGSVPPGDNRGAVEAAGDWARRRRRALMAGIHGTRLVLLMAGQPHSSDHAVSELFGEGTIVRGPVGPGLAGAVESAADAIAGHDVAAAWPDAPRLVDATALISERVINGDARAAQWLRRTVFAPLDGSASPLVETLDAYLGHGGSLEPAARALFVHPNTVRYRLRRVAELTGLDPWVARDQLALRIALVLGRLDH